MCGIVGFVDATKDQYAGNALLKNMLESTNHRGPNNTGMWDEGAAFLGHNRLSIIDLSNHANQPMLYEEFSLTFNGEIYNYLELREELIAKGYHFETQSDTEVILVAYKEWGSSCVERFVGMWAFALWDRKAKKLFCSRDRFGIKPYYYQFDGQGFYFASEVRALKKSELFQGKLNEKQASIYLQLGWYFNQGETFYESISTLPAAHNLVLQEGKLEITEYWKLERSENKEATYEERVEKFRALFHDSIKLHIRSDVKVGACLSGGIDSSSIVSIYSSLFPENELQTFNIYYEGKNSVDERPWIKYLQDKYKNINAFFHSPSDEEILKHFDDFVDHMEFPSNGSSPFSQYFVMKMAHKNGIKVLLNGQGSDEYLAGYMHSVYRSLSDYLTHFQLGAFAKQLKIHNKTQQNSAGKSLNVLLKTMLSSVMPEQALYDFEYKNYYPNICKQKFKSPFQIRKIAGSKLDQFLFHQVMQTSLPNLLHNEDVNSMAFSIESRVPFLDHRLLEYAFSSSNEDRLVNGVTKRILRDALAPELPPEIANRTDKKGFVTPGEVKWMRGSMKFLLDIDWDKLSFIDRDAAEKVIKDYEGGNLKNAMLVWRLGVLNYWYKRNF